MITPPPGWTIERTADGVLIAPPDGPERAILRYTERRRPRRAAEELAAAGPVPAGFVETAPLTKPRRFVTIEGEHGELLARAGTLEGRAVVLVYGYVYLDDYFASLEGVVAPELVATFEQLVSGDVHLLGRVRRRAIWYAEPVGWRVEIDAFGARWSEPTGRGRIFVNPALPRSPGLVAQILDKLGVPAEPAERFTTPRGLDGERHTTGDSDFYFLGDADFLYSVRADHARDAGRALVDSIEPVPQPTRPSGDAVSFWAD